MSVSVDLQAVREEIAYEVRCLAESERADIEGRVADRLQWLASMRRRRERISELQRRRDELVALEESAAELAEDYRDQVAA